MHRLFLNGVTRQQRTASVAAARAALSAAGAWVLDYHEYSNVSAAIGFEAPAHAAATLAEALQSLAVVWKSGELEALRTASGTDELQGTVQLVFVHGEPDLKQTIPAVPG